MTKYKTEILQIVRKYNNKERVCGSVDCNLMILEIYEPDEFNKLVDKYDNVKDGIRVAKEYTGYRSIHEYLAKSDKYKEIPTKSARFGDIGIVKEKQCTFLHLGKSLFGVQNIEGVEVFGLGNVIQSDDYSYYRRV